MDPGMVSNTRLYGAAIAVVSGLYSLYVATSASRMVASSWLMAVLGVVVLVHGLVLVSLYAERLGDASGPLMVAYAIVMLLNQALLATDLLDDGSPMDAGDGGMMTASADTGAGMTEVGAAMGWDVGMVALAVLMLVSGIIMARSGGSMTRTSRL